MSGDSPYGRIVRLPQRVTGRSRQGPPDRSRAVLRDVLAERPLDLSPVAFVAAHLGQDRRPILWVQDRQSRLENGQPYGIGLQHLGVTAPVLRVHANHPRDALWAMEQGASCAGLSAVVGEIHGAPAVLDFTATKRLALRAEASNVPIYLIRSGDPGTLSAARERWRVGALPSRPNPHDPRAPGAPRWLADLFRAQGQPPGQWVASYDRAADSEDRLRLVPQSGDRTVEADHPARTNAAGG